MGNSLHKLVGKNPFTSHTASDEWPLASQLVGVELELEGLGGSLRDRLSNDTYPTWDAHIDNSLRNSGIEMVLSSPLMGKELSKAISMFFNTVPTFSASSSRASTHVHLNMLQEEDTVEVLRNLCSFYYAIEDAMYSCISESRKWAVYASPMSSNFPYEIALLFSKELNRDLWIDYLGATNKTPYNNGRHYGFNLKAMRKYGTVEFRHFPAVTSEQELRDWINLCMEIKKVAVVLDSKGTTTREFFSSAEKFDVLTDIMPIWGFRILQGLDREAALTKIESLYELLPTQPKYTGNMGSYDEHPLFKDNDKIPKSKRNASKDAYAKYAEMDITDTTSVIAAAREAILGRARTTSAPDRVQPEWFQLTAGQAPARTTTEPLRNVWEEDAVPTPRNTRDWRPLTIEEARNHTRSLLPTARRAFADTLILEAQNRGEVLNLLRSPTNQRVIRVTAANGLVHQIIQAYL